MRALILEGIATLERYRDILPGYVRVARTHGDLRLSILVRDGVRDLLGYRELPPEIELLEEVPDYFVPGAVERRVMDLLAVGGFDLIYAPREGDIIRAARLRELAGIPGQSFASALAYRDKLRMKQHLVDAGVPVWPSAPVNDAVDFWTALDRFGLPCVLKPRSDRGSFNLEIIRDRAQAAAAIGRCAARVPIDAPFRYVLEPYSEHPMCHADGFWHDDRLEVLTVSEYVGATAARPSLGAVFGSLMVDPASERTARHRDLVERVVAALPSPRTFCFHAEIWETQDGPALNEIAARPGGRFVAYNLQNATGVEPAEFWFALETGVDPRRLGYRGPDGIRPSGSVALPYRSGLVQRVPARCGLDFVQDFRPAAGVLAGSVLPPQGQWFDTLGDVVFSAPGYPALPRNLDRLLEWAERSILIGAPGTAGPEPAR